MDRSTLSRPPGPPTPEPRSAGRRLIVGPIEDLIRATPRGVAFGAPPSGIVASPPRQPRTG